MTVSEKHTVLHIIDSLGRVGGAEEQMLENLRRFTDGNLTHSILCLFALAGNDRSSEVPDGVQVRYLYEVGVTGIRRTRMVRDMVRAIREIKPDLIHCGLPNAGLGSRVAGRWLGIPVIESLVNISHEAIRTIDNPSVAPWKLAAHRLLDRVTMRSVVRFQALSQAVAQSWIDTIGISADRLVVIPRGVDISRFEVPPRPEFRRNLLDALALPNDSFIILNVGRQVPQKGQIYALRAMAMLLKEVPQAVLLSAGTPGPISERLREETDRLGIGDRIFWLGVRSDIPDLLGASDAFVFPSLYEGLGVSLLEAMAAGLPAVTTDTAPMTEVIEHQTNGLLVGSQDPASIASSLKDLATDPSLRIRLGSAARKHIEAHFASTTTAARVEAMYREVLRIAPTP